MKITERNTNQGFVKVVPDSQDDLWHLYNVISKGDEAYAYSSRAIKSDTATSRPKSAERVSVFMGIKVDNVSWDKFLGKLRIHGTIIHAPDPIPPGAHHTITIALSQPLTIVKKTWPTHLIDRLIRASENEKPILIVAIDDEGFAIAETKQYGVDIRLEERQKLPGKHEAEKRESATKQYFVRITSSLRQLWTQKQQPIVVIGAGFVKNDYIKFLADEDACLHKAIADVKSTNNGGTAGIYEALRSGVLVKAASQLRVIQETEVMEEVMKRLGKNEGKVAYGLEEVRNATNLGASVRLIVADSILRDAEDKLRLQLETLMRDVENQNGVVTVVSAEHEAGSKLIALGGIAALLRFSLK